MYIYFIDINKPNPKDHYPLLSIDKLIDATARHVIISLLDIILDYHQILMDEENTEKMASIMDEEVFYLQGKAIWFKKYKCNISKTCLKNF